MSGPARQGELPSAHQLKAACWVARLCARATSMPTAEAHAAYGRAATDGLFDSRDLRIGEAVLMAAGFLVAEDNRLGISNGLTDAVGMTDDDLVVLILERLLLGQRPLWMSAALTPGGIENGMIPDAVGIALAAALPDPKRREEFLLALGRRFDETERRRVGELAEACVVQACRSQLQAIDRRDLAGRVRRVSLVSDQLGYDVVAPRRDSTERRIEVKGTRASGQILTVTISRNEASVGLRDPDWSLAVCRVAPDDGTTVVGWLDGVVLRPHLPSDAETGIWQEALVYLDEQIDLRPGLPSC